MSVLEKVAASILEHLGPNATDAQIRQFLRLYGDEEGQRYYDELYGEVLAQDHDEKWNKFSNLFPDEGPLRRQLYHKHMEHFAAGATKRERLFMAANRVGKTVAGGYEVTTHLTGAYPDWWPGRRFTRNIRCWVAGDTNETTRDILQLLLLGDVAYDGAAKIMDGSGLIPADRLGRPTWKQGVNNLVDTIPVRHENGKWSSLAFKSFDQGRRVFQGTAKELIWLDEECPVDVYGECLMRTATTKGILILTFTPLLGLSELVLSFMPDDMKPDGM